MYEFAASTLSVLKDFMAVVGTVLASIGTTIGIWLAVKKWRTKQQEKADQDEQKVAKRLGGLETSVATIAATTTADKSQYDEFREQVIERLRELSDDLDNLKTQAQEHNNSLGSNQKELERLADRYEKIYQDLQQLKDHVADKFLTIANYQHDLQMWTSHINSLQTTIKDLTAMLGRKA